MHRKIYLWDKDVPYYERKYKQKKPSIVEYLLKDGKKHPCVLVIPGGAYTFVSIENEGKDICKALNSFGISAVYLNYRIAPYKHPVMETDAKRAMRLLKFNADEWNIDADKISVMGFSAGGHLACMVGLRHGEDNEVEDEIDGLSAKPLTVAACYAVASLDPEITHHETLHNLLGETPDEEMIKKLSSENIIGEDAPPFFIWHTLEDSGVIPENSIRLAKALDEAGVSNELHLFPYGPHGLGTAKDTPFAREWIPMYAEWLKKFI